MALFFVISYDTFHEILCKVFENTSLLSNEGDSDFFRQLYVRKLMKNALFIGQNMESCDVHMS